MKREVAAVVAWVSLVLAGAACAQDTPAPEYGIKEDAPLLGTRIRKEQVGRGQVAVNLPYAQLPAADKQALHDWWENIPPGDEPPFPKNGLQAVYDPVRKAQSALLEIGDLFAVASVGADGQVIEAKVYTSPTKRMADAVARILLLTPFKPAVCSGQPCRMDFPVHFRFVTTAM